jgi:uncharacterized protein (TIGR04552 family)
MRRDVLELDAAEPTPLRRAVQLDLADHEGIRLMLGGGSVIDWQRLVFPTHEEVDRFLLSHHLDASVPEDRERLRYVFNEAVSYLEEHLHIRFPRELRKPADVRDVFVHASEFGAFRRTQILSCVVLKLMHVIHHMEAADLKFQSPVSESDLLDRAEADIVQRTQDMKRSGLPVVAFYGSRKARASVISKLLAKRDNIASTVFDKLRFRVVVEQREDFVPTLQWIVRHMVPFNYVIPGQSHNNLYDPDDLAQWLDPAVPTPPQRMVDDPMQEQTGKNEFSGASYRMINFISDYPVRLRDSELPKGSFPFELGRVVYVMVEFQLLDADTARRNEEGENAHHLYKARQLEVVARRLKRGGFRSRK